MVKIVGELGQVARSFHHVAAHHGGQGQLGVAVLAGVQVQHPRYEGALQPCARAAAGVEAAARQLRAPLEVYDAQPLAQLPVRQALEAQFHRVAFLAVNAVIFGIAAERNFGQRHIGQAQQHLVNPLLDFLGAGLQLVHLAAQRAHLLYDFGRGRLPGGAGVSDFPVHLVAPVAYLVGLCLVLPPGGVQFQQLFHGVRLAAGLHRPPHRLRVAPYLLNGNHSFQP